MEVESNNKTRNIVSVIIVIFVVIAIFFYITSGLKLNDKDDDKKTDPTSLKIDKNKDYIYYENIDVKSDILDMIYRDPVINLDTKEARELTSRLKNELAAIRNSVKKTNNQEIIEECEDAITDAKQKDFENFEFKNYISLIVFEYEYKCPSSGSSHKPTSYVFDVNTGKILTNENLLDLYQITNGQIIELIRNKLNSTLSEIVADDPDKQNFIRISETINNLDYNETIMIYIDDDGNLVANFVVITEEVNYNESIILKGEM